ncbi:hypothetical protein GGU11DRAFT_8714 [Lentinula aff. detonsa]|uniref:Uncharacterized protein n=1 Tax=Lentinula aff. detonsa TaxID=2804958 RepID=A0AA38ND43_9AGAR|nr:hypothetical protein GGU10DRAFT_182627 [Lentinula aff. detonsa]KAJ3802381.1 hypothetical protein GGU11DRAFT_8714 [Lentinula aff. detonsa]
MRFLTALLPLITLAVHVVATNPGQSIPLNNVLPYPQPARLSSPHSFSDAATLVDVDLERQQRPSAQRVQQRPSAQRVSVQQRPSAQRPCDACLQKALHIAEDVVKAPGRLLIASAAELAELAVRNPKFTCTIVTCFVLGTAAYEIYHDYFHEKREECEGCHVRRTGLSLPTPCQPLDCEDVCSATSHTEGPGIVSNGGHAKRDVARLNYRRRLELD